MKTSAFIIFISIVLAVYGSANYYIYYHGRNALAGAGFLRLPYTILFLFLSLSYIAARILQGYGESGLGKFFLVVGSFWMAAVVYFFLACLIIDAVRGINHFVTIYPAFIFMNYEKVKLGLFFGLIAITAGILTYGFINAKHSVVNEYTITTDKKLNAPLTIVMASDIHLGPLSCGNWFDEQVEKINSLNPDVILLVGDVIDEDVKPVIEQNLGEHLLNLKSKYGVYAVTGNHEYIGGVEPAVKYLTEHGIKVLRDTAVTVDNRFCLIGREDKDKPRFTGRERKPLEELIKETDTSLPVVLMNHQPSNLSELEGKNIDLSLSGHTHHGQFWPNSIVTSLIYEVSRGFLQKYGTNIYVSNGLGTWGPPIRVGNRPEIVRFIIKSKSN
ncbi:MAG: metallophosphoesterase [Bacteroidetes bacterium]|nr:metallophosphoesterase [Bacteroidota bacterium]